MLAKTNGEITLEAVKAMPALGDAVDEAGRLRPPVGNVPRGVVKASSSAAIKCPRVRACCSRSPPAIT